MANIKQKTSNALFPANDGKSEEVNFKKNFCEKYFDKGTWSLDVLKQVDVLLQDRKGRYLLYIESKHHIRNRAQRREAIAQAILTNKKQEAILNRVAIIYLNEDDDETIELIDCSDDSVMYNNDINRSSEKPSNPTKDAIDRINDRVKGRIKTFKKITREVAMVPDTQQFKRYFQTLLIHNLDSQVANHVCLQLDWILPNHDAFTLHPNDVAKCRKAYIQKMEEIYHNRKNILQNYFKSIGITEEFKFNNEPEVDKFSGYCLK